MFEIVVCSQHFKQEIEKKKWRCFLYLNVFALYLILKKKIGGPLTDL